MAYSAIKLYKENKDGKKFVIIYYKHDGSTLRHRTGIVLPIKDFDKKASRVKPSNHSYESYNEIISNAHELIEDIILDYVKRNGIKPSGKYIKDQLKAGRKIRKQTLDADLIDCYSDFLNEKKILFTSPDKSPTSLRDYVSTKNALIEYSQVNGPSCPTDLNDMKWLNKFNIFLSKPRPKLKDYRFKTSEQNDKTRSKRFGVLKNFGDWLLKEKFLNDTEILDNFKVIVQDKSYYTLKFEELGLIQNHKFKSIPQQKAIDMFVVACHTGLRYSDVTRINKARIRIHKKVSILILNNQKTKVKIEVPLSEKVLQILDKYNYNLNLMTSQKTNYYIHKALKNINPFLDEYEYGLEGDTLPKHELVTFHTGRRTFITNLVNNNVSLNAIMKMTGHKKISTLQKYINPDYDLVMDNIRIFNDL